MTVHSTSFPAPENVPELKPLVDHEMDADFVALLTASLTKAKQEAQENLAPVLFAALQWPLTLRDYLDYLVWFARWIPQQSDDPAWLDPGTSEHQEVYDRLCHFYWLIDQSVGSGRTVVQDIPWFREFLVGYANVWGQFLDTTDSFNDKILQTFIDDSPKYRVQDSLIGNPPRPNAASGWLTFNQFFARELNSGLRPIAAPSANSTVVAPADCTYKQKYSIAADSSIPEITIKGTHKYANVKDLLAGSEYAGAFTNGYFIHFFLGPYSYHRFHTPVAGKVKESYPIQGQVYLKVQLAQKQFQAYDASEGAYEFAQARGVITIDTCDSPFGNVGIVAVIPVGMCQVSGVNMTHAPGATCLKGDEFGYFTFGGSDIVILFQQGTNPQYNQQFGSAQPPYSLYGSEVAQLTTLSH